MRWPWQEEPKRAADPVSTPLAPKLPPSVPTVAAPSVAGPGFAKPNVGKPNVAGPGVATPVPRAVPPPQAVPPPPTPPADSARPAITRSDPFAGLPRLTPAAELDLPELLPDMPPSPPPMPLPAPAPVTPAVSAPGPSSVAGRHFDAPPEAPPRADAYVGRRRAGH
jgi:hypothetical protein